MAVQNGRPDEALGDSYPFQDKYAKLKDGHSMHYIEAGRAGLRRPTFLLLHGSPTWSFLYRKFIKPLSKHGRVIAVDHMGFGRSDHPSDSAYYSLEKHIQNLEEFAAATGIKRVIPVMQDWGGPIGLGYATRHPDNIAGLVLMNTWAFTEKLPMKLPIWFKALKAKGVGEYAIGRQNVYVEKMIPKLLMGTATVEQMQGYRHPFSNAASRTAVVHAPRMIPTSPKHPDWPTMDAIEKALPKLGVPARILWATDDPAFGKRYAWAFKELLPNAETPRFVKAGHWLQEDIPDEVISQIQSFAKAI